MIRPRPRPRSGGVRRTLFVVALILVVTVLLVAVKYWVVNRYLLGH